MVLPVQESHEFREKDFVGGHPSLDFLNTVTGRNGYARDLLADCGALVAWAAKANVISKSEQRDLLQLIRADPRTAEEAFRQAVDLREAMYAFLDALTKGTAPPLASLASIDNSWRAAASGSRIRWAGYNGLIVETPCAGLHTIASRVVISFVDLGPRLSSNRLRKCAGHSCAWFFLDSSKGGRRRWCDMAVCGNAAKYARARAHSRRSMQSTHEER